MKSIFPLITVLVLILAACNNEGGKAADSPLEKRADSLFDEVMEGHDVGMAKDKALEDAIAATQAAIDSMNKLPVAAKLLSINYKRNLDTLLKELQYADFAMDKWMKEMNWTPDTIEVNTRINYLEEEKVKVEKVKEAIFSSLAKADSILQKK